MDYSRALELARRPLRYESSECDEVVRIICKPAPWKQYVYSSFALLGFVSVLGVGVVALEPHVLTVLFVLAYFSFMLFEEVRRFQLTSAILEIRPDRVVSRARVSLLGIPLSVRNWSVERDKVLSVQSDDGLLKFEVKDRSKPLPALFELRKVADSDQLIALIHEVLKLPRTHQDG